LSYTKQLPTVQKELQEMEESLDKVRADVAGYQTRVDEFEPERRKKEVRVFPSASAPSADDRHHIQKAIQELGTARHKVSAGIEHWIKGMARNQATLEGMLAQQAKLEAEAVVSARRGPKSRH
jgi:phage shock protein A